MADKGIQVQAGHHRVLEGDYHLVLMAADILTFRRKAHDPPLIPGEGDRGVPAQPRRNAHHPPLVHREGDVMSNAVFQADGAQQPFVGAQTFVKVLGKSHQGFIWVFGGRMGVTVQGQVIDPFAGLFQH